MRRMRHIQELDQSGTLASMPQKEASRLRHELEEAIEVSVEVWDAAQKQSQQ